MCVCLGRATILLVLRTPRRSILSYLPRARGKKWLRLCVASRKVLLPLSIILEGGGGLERLLSCFFCMLWKKFARL